jgi:hypothetical protein
MPMVESYVDICNYGCLEIEAQSSSARGFVQEFIRTAAGWNAYWVNGRIYPRGHSSISRTPAKSIRLYKKEEVLKYVQLHDPG